MFKSHNVLNELCIFFKRHKVICIILLVCVLIVIKFSKIPVPNWLPNLLTSLLLCPEEQTTAYEWMSLINGLCFAFVTSVITYVIIQYIPARKKAINAFAILKKELCSLYLYMSHLIFMYLFEIGVEKTEERITLEDLSEICRVEITDQFKYCKIRDLRNGRFDNSIASGYNLYQDSKKYADLINKAIGQIKGTVCSASLDSEIIDTLSAIENNWFLRYFSYLKSPYTLTPGYQNVIMSFDKGFFEFINCHCSMNAYNFDLLTYEFSVMTEKEIEEEKERQLFLAPRTIYKYSGESEAIRIANGIIALEPSKERLEKSVGVVLEMLVYYDYSAQKSKTFLKSALCIAEYIRANETDEVGKAFAEINVMQIKKRLNTISTEENKELKALSNKPNLPIDVILGASIVLGDFKTADESFNKLSDEEKAIFVQFPVYRLWPNPPQEPNLNPMVFLQH